MRNALVVFLLNFLAAVTLAKEIPAKSHNDISNHTFLILAMLILASIDSLLSIIMVAYLSMDELVLELKNRKGTDEEKEQVSLLLIK